MRRRNKGDQINIAPGYGTWARQDSTVSKCIAAAHIPTDCEHLLYNSHKLYQTIRMGFFDFWSIQYCFQVISIPLMSHWKASCFHWAGVCHMHAVPFCTWRGVAGPLRKRPTQNLWTPRGHQHATSNRAAHPEASTTCELPTNTRLQSETYLQKVRLISRITLSVCTAELKF